VSHVLAVDGGGTSTRAVVADLTGRCLGYRKAGSGNPVSAGPELAAASFTEAIGGALGQAGVAGADIDVMLFSMAGGLTGHAVSVFGTHLRALGLAGQPRLASDVLGTFCAGTPSTAGYCLEAGTGCGANRVEGSAVVAVADGLGWLVGDDGSGFWLGHQVARAAFDDLDRRGPATALTEPVMAALGVAIDRARPEWGRPRGLGDAVQAVYRLRPVELSRFAHLAFEAGADPVAAAIRQRAAEGLARTLQAVLDPAVTGPFVFGGGVLARHPEFAAAVATLAGVSSPTVVQDGAAGAVVLALREVGVTVDEPVFARIQDSLGPLSA
jgi:N-acetylglucosamine kinase-like BadF-type ATPase